MIAIRKPYLLSLTIGVIFVTMGMLTPAFSGGPDPRENVSPANGFTEKAEIGISPEELVGVHTYVFTCVDDFAFVARTDNQTAWLFLPSETLELTKNAVGEYRTEDVIFHLKDQESRLQLPAGEHLDCRNNRRRAIWEHAKLNGADFRAIGNEPGWNLEILNQEKIILVTDYGSKKYEFESPLQETDPTARATRYQVDRPGSAMTLTISAESCHDSMSGEAFESKVEVVLNGETLRGCGRALH